MINIFQKLIVSASAFVLSIGYVLGVNPTAPNLQPKVHHLDVSQIESVASFAPTPSPTVTFSPPQKPSVVYPKPIHDGSLTGQIVDYDSFCEGKTIKIYENELILYTLPSGKQIYSTKEDIQCFENALKNKTGSTSQPSQINNQGSLVSVPCPTKFGNYTEYGMSYDEANQRCEQLQAQGELSQNMPMTLPTPQPIKTDNSALLSQCLATAQKSYDSATDSLVDLYGGPAGIPINANNQEIRDQAEAQFSKDRANCYHKYGY